MYDYLIRFTNLLYAKIFVKAFLKLSKTKLNEKSLDISEIK